MATSEQENYQDGVCTDECLRLVFRHLDPASGTRYHYMVCRQWTSVLRSSVLKLTLQGDTPLAEEAMSWSLRHFTSLTELDLVPLRRAVDDKAFGAMSVTCPKLLALRLAQPSISLEAFKTVKGFSRLQRLHLEACDNLTPKGIRALGRSCKKLQELSLDYSEGVNNTILAAIASFCPNLRSLSLATYLHRGTSAQLRKVTSRLQETLSGEEMQCADLADFFVLEGGALNLSIFGTSALAALGKGCPKLRSLCLDGCGWLDKKKVFKALGNFPSLDSLSLRMRKRPYHSLMGRRLTRVLAIMAERFPWLEAKAAERLVRRCTNKQEEFAALDSRRIEPPKLPLSGEETALYFSKLQRLNLEGWRVEDSVITALGTSCRKLRSLDLSNDYLEAGPGVESLGVLFQGCVELEEVYLHGWQHLSTLPESIASAKKLRVLSMEGHSLECLPEEALGRLGSLQELNLTGKAGGICTLPRVPKSLEGLSSLRVLKISNCIGLKNWPGGIKHLEVLEFDNCYCLGGQVSLSFSQLTRLRQLSFCSGTSLKTMSDSLGCLQKLEMLKISHCRSLCSLPSAIGQLTSLSELILDGLASLSTIPDEVAHLKCLQQLRLTGCEELTLLPSKMGQLQSLQVLHLISCGSLFTLPPSLGDLAALKELSLVSCEELRALPDSLGSLSVLGSLHINKCRHLAQLPIGLGQLPQLKVLQVIECVSVTSLPPLSGLHNLRELSLRGCSRLVHLPRDICNLSGLRELNLGDCSRLANLPEEVGRGLVALQKLSVCNCVLLANLPASLERVETLQSINLRGCAKLRPLPAWVHGLEEVVGP